MRGGIFSENPKTGIEEIDNLFKNEPVNVVLQKSFKKKLESVKKNGGSELLLLPEEQSGEDWLKTLGVTPEPTHLVAGIDPENSEVSISISETNIPEVFLKTQARLKDGQAKVFNSLVIQTEKPTSIV